MLNHCSQITIVPSLNRLWALNSKQTITKNKQPYFKLVKNMNNMAKPSLPKIQQLNESNYPTWIQEMWALLRGKGLWRLVSDKEKRHSSEEEKQNDNTNWACGIITLGVEQAQCVLFQTVSDDPVKTWTTLESAHDDFFSIRKDENESLHALIVRIKGAMTKMQNLWPKNFDLNKLDAELVCIDMCTTRELCKLHLIGPFTQLSNQNGTTSCFSCGGNELVPTCSSPNNQQCCSMLCSVTPLS